MSRFQGVTEVKQCVAKSDSLQRIPEKPILQVAKINHVIMETWPKNEMFTQESHRH